MFVNTVFGWIAAGPRQRAVAEASTFCSQVSLEKQIELFFATEEIQPVSSFTQEEKDCEQYFQQQHFRDEEGRYIVKLPFRTSGSCMLATRVLQQLASDEGGSFPLGKKALCADFYVDDLLSGADNDHEAEQLVSELRQLLRKGGFTLKKWNTNRPNVLRGIPKNEKVLSTVQLECISKIKVARHVFGAKGSLVELHCFCDASEAAYGGCIYVRSIGPDGIVKVELLASKSKPAPLKRVSLAKLELCAAVLVSKLYDAIRKPLKIDVSEVIFWSDSTIVLAWLESPPYNWTTYVANRVSQVQDLSKGHKWLHVKGMDNPADDVSRGLFPEELMNKSRWFHGPQWLKQSSSQWVGEQTLKMSPEKVPERRKIVMMVST
uniref:Reverse transcriptase domain-containing protein n=1 Tax=Anopheles dirus TaxID=7168 RepID=A0A182NPZ5_9DIPT